MKISAYTTIFNLKNIQLSIIDALDNWFYYFDEVIISTLTKDVNEINEEIKNYKFFDKIKIVDIDIDFNNLFWDGILKNNGLQNCSNEIVFQIDLDPTKPFYPEFRFTSVVINSDGSIAYSTDEPIDPNVVITDFQLDLSFSGNLPSNEVIIRQPVPQCSPEIPGILAT
jgi:hypothetical protein